MARPGVVGDRMVIDVDDLARRHELVSAGGFHPPAEGTEREAGLDRSVERAVQSRNELAKQTRIQAAHLVSVEH